MLAAELGRYTPDDARAEFEAIVDYHNNLVNWRFTIVGLYVAGMGFLASAVLGGDTTWAFRAAGSGLAWWITVCLWILELRTRGLYTNLAQRGVEIEHRYWGLTGKDWYQGFFSRQYKQPPPESMGQDVPPKPPPDCPTLAGCEKPLPIWVSKGISYRSGLDLLYAGSGLFWLVLLIVALAHVIVQD